MDRVKPRILALLVTFLMAAPLSLAETSAQATITPDDVERLLVPIVHLSGFPGRYGSLWAAEFRVRNSADVPVVFSSGGPVRNLPDGGLIQIAPMETGLYSVGGPRGAIYIVEKAYASQVHLSLRIADVTRRPVSHGTELPVVREADWRTAPIELLEIPTDFSVRQSLRVYDPDATNSGQVRVTIYPLQENQPVAETVVEPRAGSDRAIATTWYTLPSYAEIPSLVDAFPQIAAYERVRVRLEPLTQGLRFWAFVAITDNQTQQVSVVTPQ